MIENNNEVVLDRQEYETLKEGNENQFQLRWLVMPDFIYSSDLSFTEAKIFSFLWTYKSDKFYFSNEQLARMFNVSEKSISVSVNNLKNEGYINLHYEIKSGGGQIRFISISNKYNKVRLEENDNLDWKKTSITTGRKLPDFLKDNKINDNNIKDYTPLPPKEGEIKNEIETQPQPEPTGPIKQQSQNLNDIDKLLEDIKNSYNNILGSYLSECKIFNKQRKSCLKARINENKERANLEWWEKYFNDVKNMPFLLGDNDHWWRADFEWLIRPTNMPKVLEGRYINLGNGKKKLNNMIKMSDKEIEEKYAKFDK